MISGAAGPGGTKVFASMATGPILLQVPDKLNLNPGGEAQGTPSDVGEAVGMTVAQAKFVDKFDAETQTLKFALSKLGMTPYFPKSLAGPLVDPILGKHRDTEQGWYVLRQVDTDTFDFKALKEKKDIGSPLMYKAFESGMQAAPRYVTVGAYLRIIAKAFTGDFETMLVWYFRGRHFDPFGSEGELQPRVANLVGVVEGAQFLVLPGSSPKWRVDLGNAMAAASDMDPTLQRALTNIAEERPKPTVAQVLDVAADVFMNGFDEPRDPGFKVEPFHGKRRDDRATIALGVKI